MQELRSTEILDKQIHDEAVKKVQAILEQTEKDCKAIEDSVDQDLKDARKQKGEVYEKKLNNLKKNLEATLPLEKQRLELSYIQESLTSAINDYVFSLSEDERLSLLLSSLEGKKDLISKNKFTAYVYGLDFEKAKKSIEKELKTNLSDVKKTEFGKLIVEDGIELKTQQGIILESDDKTLRLRLTLSQLVNSVLDNNRDKLVAALFGEGAND